jgi:dipeptidase E
MAATLDTADVVVVSGGNTLFAVDRWRAVGLDKHLLRAVARGVVFSGGSAGLMWLFTAGHSDSADPDTYLAPMVAAAAAEAEAAAAADLASPSAAAAAAGAPAPAGEPPRQWAYIRVPCLGVLPGLCCPHHDRVQSNGVLRAQDFDGMLARHRGERGVCVDHWAALVIDRGRYAVVAVAGKPGSVVLGEGRDAAPRFEPGAGVPGVWVKEWVGDAVQATLAAPEGAVETLFRPAWLPIVEDDRVLACRAGNPSS